MKEKEHPKFLKMMEKYMPGPNSKYKEKPATFFVGVIHGLVLPLTFIYSQFESSVRLYETNNIRRWYNLGFVIGIVILVKAVTGT